MYELVAITTILLGILLFYRTRERLDESTVTTGTATETKIPDQLSRVIDMYKTNYIEYRTTGNEANKDIYETAKLYIEDYLKTLQDRVSKDATYVNEFLDKYGSTNADLESLQSMMKTIREKGPKMEDQYLTLKNTDDAPIDYKQYYVKGVILVGIVGMLVVLSLF